MKYFLIICCFISVYAQKISIHGQLKIGVQQVVLKAPLIVGDSLMATTTTNEKGVFNFEISNSYRGAVVLEVDNEHRLILLLNDENIDFSWTDYMQIDALKFNFSEENQKMLTCMNVFENSQSKLTALKYLLDLYSKDAEVINQKNLVSILQNEITYENNRFLNYYNQLPDQLYVKKYVKYRQFLMDIINSTSPYGKKIDSIESNFLSFNFNDPDLLNSGLYFQILENYFQILEGYGQLDQVYSHINKNIDYLLESLMSDTRSLDVITEHLFMFFEKRSLFKSSEYLALKMLNQSSCRLSDKNTALFEQYRKLAIGKTAPDIDYGQNKKISGLSNDYKLVVFGASWCPTCQNEYPKLIEKYAQLKTNNNLEIVYISIDTNLDQFKNFYNNAPFIVYCDQKGWETSSAREYFVFATPTYFLLDKDLKILAKIRSSEHLDAWLKSIKSL
jgi:thiol-disulfide isomerase/thioredoxin